MDQAASHEAAPTMGSHIGSLSMEGDRKWRPLLSEKFYEAHPQIAPNGRWMAYVSWESGLEEVYVRPFPEVDKGRWQVSTSGGRDPIWSHDGRELFYRNANSVFAVDVQTEPTFKAGKPALLFQGAYFSYIAGKGHIWDLSPDGKRFLMMKEYEAATSTSSGPQKINIVLNWTDELKQRVPVM